MSEIKTFKFEKDKFDKIKNYKFGSNWPVVYLIENGKEAYVGETINANSRSKQHFDNPERSKLKTIHLISDEEYNKSATLDIESWLIQYMSADGSFVLQNGNAGLKNHNYYDRDKYKAKFELIWQIMLERKLAKQELVQIRNSDVFKYSPYKTLTEDQFKIARSLFRDIKNKSEKTYIINGEPGTGKSILAIYLVKYLKEKEETKDLKIGLVVPMVSLRRTIQRVFRNIKGLSSSMVLGPNDVTKQKYDILIVDEAHRLKQRKNITNYKSFDDTNKKLNLPKEATELDWIMKSAKNQIFFYDQNQSVKPSDIGHMRFDKLDAVHYTLTSQMRVNGGQEYIDFVSKIFDQQPVDIESFEDYEFKIFDDVSHMVTDIKNKDKEHHLCRVVAGYAWEWVTRGGEATHDIDIDGYKLKWNSVAHDWVNSPNALNEVGCIHTVQGYDLNYVGVIIGPELAYDPMNQKIIVHKDKYKDVNGHRGVDDPAELERYILNIYKTLLTRGIKGTYVYIVDKELKKYIQKKLGLNTYKDTVQNKEIAKEILSPYTQETIKVPLVGSAPCGEPLLGEENIEEYIEVEKNKIRPGVQYFIVMAEGDSMNKVGINDGDLVLCRYAEKAETGDRVVALLQGENVTIKYYDKKDGRRILLPKSTNPKHKPIVPEEGDEVQGVVQEVLIENNEYNEDND